MNRRRAVSKIAIPAILLVLCATVAHSQVTTPQTAPPAQPLPAQIDDHRISIDAQVTDKQGHAIHGLTVEDFKLLDNKQPAKILDFRETDARTSTTDPVSVVIVVDMINTGFQVVAREREQLGEFLKQDGGRLGHPTSIAILTEKGLKLEKVSTTDGNALLTSLNGANSDLRIEGRDTGIYGAADRLEWSLGQLSQLAAFEATKPGRKLAFFISPGWPLLSWAGLDATTKERQWTFKSIVDLTNGLREARVVLYTINPFEIGRTNTFYYQNYLKGVSKVNDAEYADLGLQVLATHTGGQVFVTGMDIKGELNQAVRDANSFYTVVFEKPPADRPNEYHDLHLDVDKPATVVRTTSGYYANVPR